MFKVGKKYSPKTVPSVVAECLFVGTERAVLRGHDSGSEREWCPHINEAHSWVEAKIPKSYSRWHIVYSWGGRVNISSSFATKEEAEKAGKAYINYNFLDTIEVKWEEKP